MASELNNAFSLERALQVGMIPLVLNSPPEPPESVLSTYLDLYLQEEVTRHDAAGLEAFHTDYPESTCTLLYRGTESLKITENCRALPVERFLRELIPNAPLPI